MAKFRTGQIVRFAGLVASTVSMGRRPDDGDDFEAATGAAPPAAGEVGAVTVVCDLGEYDGEQWYEVDFPGSHHAYREDELEVTRCLDQRP